MGSRQKLALAAKLVSDTIFLKLVSDTYFGAASDIERSHHGNASPARLLSVLGFNAQGGFECSFHSCDSLR